MHRVKKLIPNSWKYPYYWLFKSPQRQFGFKTLVPDLKGVFLFPFLKYCYRPQLKNLAVCVGIKDRNYNLINHLIKSLNHCQYRDKITLSVFDCGSEDVENPETEIRKHWKGKLIFNSQPVQFARAYSFNRAVMQADEALIFICDADMQVPENLLRLCNAYTSFRMVWYPIVFYLYQNKPSVESKENGYWMKFSGKGMLACKKQDFIEIGMLNEQFTEWGREDDELWERFVKAGYCILRNRQKGLIHHWHPVAY